MSAAQEIEELNLLYLVVAQHLLRNSRAKALYQLGIDGKTADLIAALTPVQLSRMARTNILLCSFRSSDARVWELLVKHAKETEGASVSKLHATLLLLSGARADPDE